MAFDLSVFADALDLPEPAAVSLDLLTAAARSLLQPDNIPQPLKDLAQWTCWRYQDKGKNKKPTKPPIDAKTGRCASSKEPETWSTFDAALAAFNADSTLAGLNVVLTPDDPIVAIDIDDYTGNDPAAAAALSSFAGTYAERSPSGGLHIFAFGKSPVGGLKTNGIFEVKRALTVTGQRLPGHAADLTAQQEAIERYHAQCLNRPAEQPNPTYTEKNGAGAGAGAGTEPADLSFVCVGNVDYSHRLELALTNPATAALYHGDFSGFAGKRSSAELSLCIHLLRFADGNTDIVTGWLNSSQCSKWLERDRDNDVYRRNTLEAALRGWDGVCFVDPWQAEIDRGRELAEGLLRGRKQAGHDPDNAGQTGHSGVSGQAGHTGTGRDNPLFVPVSRFIGTPSPPQWTVRKWLPAASMAVLFGEPGCGKSFLAVDWCCCVASGQDWNGNRVKQGAVLYIAGEGHYGLRRRFATWQQQHGVIPDTLYISERAVTLDPTGAKAVFEAVGLVSEIPALIVIDTLSSVIAGDENNAVDMNAFLTVLKKLLGGTAATILVVHHTGHGSKDRARGHSSLKAALDAEFRAERCDGQGTLTCTKPKDMEPPAPLNFELTQVELPDAWRDPEEPDEPVTSCIFTVTGNADGKPGKARELPASQKIALTALHTALVAEGGTFAGQFAVHIDHWRKAAYAAGIADTPDAKKKAFQRTRTSLLASGDVKCNDDLYWFADAGKQNSASLLNTAKRKQQEANADS